MSRARVRELHLHGQRGILDIIDSLRFRGINQYVDLPQIIVCGDQSSGKSSVLEAISGVAFPTQDALCTRFATELILRRCQTQKSQCARVSIIPGSTRTEMERDALAAFKPKLDSRELDMGRIIEDAKAIMGLKGKDKVFCNDILRVEISSPDQPHLTLVDLPGLFLASNKDQSLADSEIVRSLVLSYMEQPRSIILAVVSAKSELTLQQVTQRAREKDPEGKRTLGLITKPDTLHEGSESEQAYFELAQNKDIQFRLGWHVLRNRDYTTRNTTLAERDAAEKAFFSRGVWKLLNPRHLGIDSLRSRLSKVLHDQIITHLPMVLLDIRSEISECQATMARLGSSRATSGERRRYLLQVSQAFSGLIKAGVDGDYSNHFFFGDSSTQTGYERRLRARVQHILTNFAESMQHKGNSITLVEHEHLESEKTVPKKVFRSTFVRNVTIMMQRNRGRELPGTFNPLIVGEMFSTQCQPWVGISKTYTSEILTSCRTFLIAAIQHVADETTAACMEAEVLHPSMERIGERMEDKLRELLRPHTEGHPITYNHYLTENVQKIQTARAKEKIRGAMTHHCWPDAVSNEKIIPAKLFSDLLNITEPNMENFAAMTAVDFMEAYYKVALKTFIDEVSVLAVEECLLQKLPSIFSADSVCDLSDESVERLAGECDEVIEERRRTQEKLAILEDGQRQLGRLSASSTLQRDQCTVAVADGGEKSDGKHGLS